MAIILAALPALRAAQEPTIDPIKQADELFRSGKFAEAERTYAAALAKDASNSRAALRLGEIALLGNRFEKAERNLKRAIELRPDDKRPKLLLAEAYYRQDRLTQAAPLFRAAGREVTADTLASFKGLIPYEVIGRSDTTRVKFVQTDPLPVIRVQFSNGEEGLLVIDTGASELFLDTRLVEKLGLPQFGSTTGTFAGGKSAPVGHARLDSIQLGDFQIKNLPVIVKDVRTPVSVPGEAAPVGVIGTVVFYHFFATLDYPNGELVLQRKTDETRAELTRQAKTAGTHVVPFWMAETHTMVAWGRVDDAEPCLFFADTGLAGGGFLCPESTIKAAGIDLTGLPSFQGMGGGGPVTVTPFTVKELSLGKAKQRNVTGMTGAFPDTLEYSCGFRIGGIISHGFFRPYALTFDFDRMQLYLSPGR
jgi:hypothetical protein